MYMPTPEEIAKTLEWELGIESGIRYAERIAANRGMSAVDYTKAAEILKAKLPAHNNALNQTLTGARAG